MDRQSPSQVRINRAGTVLCEPGWRWDPPPERMDDLDLWYVWTGVGTMVVDDAAVPVHRGKAFVLRPGHVYHGTHDPQRRLGVCYIHFDQLDARGRKVTRGDSLPPLHGDVQDADLYERLTRRIVLLHNSGHPNDQRAAALLLESVLMTLERDQLPSQAESGRRVREARMADIMRHIRENPGKLFTVEELAEHAAYAVDHFTKLFTEAAGVSPKEFCIRVRIERAQELLRNSDLSINEVAAMLGYGDVFHFSRQFKLRTGVAPTQWRHADASRRPARTKR